MFIYSIKKMSHISCDVVMSNVLRNRYQREILKVNGSLRDVPIHHRDLALCEFAIYADVFNLVYIPKHICTKEFYTDAIKKRSDIVEYMPINLLTYEMCLVAVNKKPILIRCSNIRRFHTLDMWMIIADKYVCYDCLGLSNDVLSATVAASGERGSMFRYMRSPRNFIQIAYTLTKRKQFETFLMGAIPRSKCSMSMLYLDIMSIIAQYVAE